MDIVPKATNFVGQHGRWSLSLFCALILIFAVIASPDQAFAKKSSPGVGAGAGINAQDEIYSAAKGHSKTTKQTPSPSKSANKPNAVSKQGKAKQAKQAKMKTPSGKTHPRPKYKVSYETMCEMVNAGGGNCITFDEEVCPTGNPLITRTITTTSGNLVSKDSYCTREPAPDLPAGSSDDAGGIQTAIQAAIKEQRKIEVTPDRFQSFPILSSKLFSQPNGFSLRNGHAHLYATPNPQTFNVEIFDEPVRVRAIPQSYLWNYGDGHSRKLQKPGKPMPNHTFDQPTDTSHVYEETGDFTIQLSTAYRGEYSVDGGPWMPIPGTASVPSDPMPMSVWRTKKLLVDQDCANNPGGPACDSPFLREKSAAK
ncbi:hypothetical protein [Arthrobacter rhombi]|uniref:hypothetical protein n=1 Tax=Arthrobacter rhombi TaxID=71253 RepID=UPI003FD2217A